MNLARAVLIEQARAAARTLRCILLPSRCRTAHSRFLGFSGQASGAATIPRINSFIMPIRRSILAL